MNAACAGKDQCESICKVERAGFPSFGIEFVTEGAGELMLNGHSYPLHTGDVFCRGPVSRLPDKSGLLLKTNW